MNRRRILIVGVTVLVVLAGSWMWRVFMYEPMSLDEANQRADAEMAAAVALLPDTIRAEEGLHQYDNHCSDYKEWPQSAKRSISVINLPPEEIPKYRKILTQFWLKRGYEIWDEDEDGLQVIHPHTQMSMWLELSVNHDLMSIDANSPCVGPHGRNYGQ